MASESSSAAADDCGVVSTQSAGSGRQDCPYCERRCAGSATRRPTVEAEDRHQAPEPIFQNWLVRSSGGRSVPTITCPLPVRIVCQRPERSGFPSGVRGVGASSLTRPLEARGVPVAGYGGHCADTDAETSATIPKAPAQNSRRFMFTSQRENHLNRRAPAAV